MNMAFKDRLKSLRIERGITQEELADALDVPASTIRRYESSEDGMPKKERIEAIADYFRCSVDYLLERTNDRYQYQDNNKDGGITIREKNLLDIYRKANEVDQEYVLKFLKSIVKKEEE